MTLLHTQGFPKRGANQPIHSLAVRRHVDVQPLSLLDFQSFAIVSVLSNLKSSAASFFRIRLWTMKREKNTRALAKITFPQLFKERITLSTG